MTPTSAGRAFRQALLGLACSLAPLLALSADNCRIAFDMGSSGVRAGASGSRQIVRVEFDYLAEWWAEHSLKGTVAATSAALRELPLKGGFPADCEKVGGGFSAWRLSAQADATELAGLLKRIHAESGVPILVIPQQQEGAYGYLGSRQVLGTRLTTSHVLDIGGGSLQVSGEQTSFGDALGQKFWHRDLCQALRRSSAVPCSLQPMTAVEVATARSLLSERLRPLAEKLSGTVTLTAISRPVSRNVLPAVKRLVATDPGQGFTRAAITQAIDQLALLPPNDTAIEGAYAAYLISDMLLVEAVLQATGGHYLAVAEVDLTNIPGLINDERAFLWGVRYDCYLERLRSSGLHAYESDPASCPQ